MQIEESKDSKIYTTRLLCSFKGATCSIDHPRLTAFFFSLFFRSPFSGPANTNHQDGGCPNDSLYSPTPDNGQKKKKTQE